MPCRTTIWRKKNIEHCREWETQYRLKNIEHINARRDEYYENNKKMIMAKNQIYRANNREKRRESDRRYYMNNMEKVKTYMRDYTKRLETQVYTIIPNRCYYENGYCSGELQWDHRNGDGKEWRSGVRPNKRQQLGHIIKNPDRWMRLCEHHNKMKVNTPKDTFEAEILEMAERIKKRSYVRMDISVDMSGQNH